MIDEEVKEYIRKSVLCWLATCDKELIPNVSPKEMFTYKDDNFILIADLASPISFHNIKVNPHVCVSFIDIFVQKGFKVKGLAKIIKKSDPYFSLNLKFLTDLFTDKFPVKSIIEITVTNVERIQAPSYFLYKDTTEKSQIESALNTYKVAKYD